MVVYPYVLQASQGHPLATATLCVGTNVGPGSRPLRFAEKDAVDVAHLMSGHAGVLRPARIMKAPTRAGLRRALHDLCDLELDVFVFYNSGHGSPDGILLRDGMFEYGELAQFVQAINAAHSLVILDVCHAGAYLRNREGLGDVEVGGVDFLTLLAEATPGARVLCSVAAHRNAGEGVGVRNGHFTASLLESAATTPSDLHGWITDTRWFAATAAIAKQRWAQPPVAVGLTADLPLLRDQAWVQGRGAIDVRCARGVCDVYTRVGGRQGLPTAIQVDVCNAHGYRIAGGGGQFVPTSNDHPERGSYRLPFDVVLGDETTHYYLQSTSRAPLSVTVSVSDLRGRVLGQVQRSLVVQRATP